jgi:hypothetical protein
MLLGGLSICYTIIDTRTDFVCQESLDTMRLVNLISARWFFSLICPEKEQRPAQGPTALMRRAGAHPDKKTLTLHHVDIWNLKRTTMSRTCRCRMAGDYLAQDVTEREMHKSCRSRSSALR